MYADGMTRVLILCTHNSARSQMAEALTREAARNAGVELDVHSAGTEATRVKDEAKTVMADLGIDPENLREYEHPQEKLSHYSKRTVDIEYARRVREAIYDVVVGCLGSGDDTSVGRHARPQVHDARLARQENFRLVQRPPGPQVPAPRRRDQRGALGRRARIADCARRGQFFTRVIS